MGMYLYRTGGRARALVALLERRGPSVLKCYPVILMRGEISRSAFVGSFSRSQCASVLSFVSGHLEQKVVGVVSRQLLLWSV